MFLTASLLTQTLAYGAPSRGDLLHPEEWLLATPPASALSRLCKRGNSTHFSKRGDHWEAQVEDDGESDLCTILSHPLALSRLRATRSTEEEMMDPGTLLGNCFLELLPGEMDESVPYIQVEESMEVSAGQSPDTIGDPDVFYTVEGEEVCQCSNTGEAYDKIAALAEYLLKDQHEQPMEEIFGNLASEETVTETGGDCAEGKRRPSSCSDGPEAKRRKSIVHAPALYVVNGDSVSILPSGGPADVTAQCDFHLQFSVATVGPLGRGPKLFGPRGSPILDLSLSNTKEIQVILTFEPLAPLLIPPGPGDALENILPGEGVPLKAPESQPVPSRQDHKCPELVEAFCAKLKSHFREACQLAPLERSASLDRLYIDGDLVQGHLESKSGRNADPRPCNLKEKTLVRRKQLFHMPGKKDTGTKIIVVLGKPGMGKSHLVQKTCLDWSNGRLPRYDLVFRFDCRRLALATEDAHSFKHLLFDECGGPQEEVDEVYQYALQNPKKVLLLFDGFEELKDEEGIPAHASDGPPSCGTRATLAGLFQRKLLNGCTVLLTTQPKDKLHLSLPRMDMTLEMTGFSKQQTEEYLAQYFHGRPFSDKAVNFIRRSPYLFSHCSHPGLCQFVCASVSVAWSEDLPSTLTSLFVKSLLPKLAKTEASSKRQILEAMAHVAWRLGQDRQNVFQGHHFPSEEVQHFALDSGLVVKLAAPQTHRHLRTEADYTFSSFVVQNFFFALHLVLAREIKDKRLTKYLRLICKSKTFLSTWELVPRFLSGLLFLEDGLRSSLLSGDDDAERMLSKKRRSLSKYIRKLSVQDLGPDKLLGLLRCVCEMDDRYLGQHLALELPPHLSFQGLSLPPSDVCILHSILSRTAKTFSLDLRGSSVGLEGLQLLATGRNVSTCRVSLGDTVRLYKHLWETEAGEQLQATLEKFVTVPLKAETMKDVEDLLALVRLQEEMTLGRAEIAGSKSCRIPAITDLRQLEFMLGPVCGFEGLQKLVGILDAFPVLQQLDLDSPNENEIGDAGVAVLSAVLPRLLCLETLNLSRNKITDVGAEKLAGTLPALPLLKTLSLYNNDIGDAGAGHLAEMLPRVVSLRVLDLQCNKITAGGAQRFTESLRKCPHVQRVRLWNPTIPHGVLGHLQQLDPRIRML